MSRDGRNSLDAVAAERRAMVVGLRRLAARLGPNVSLVRFCREYGIRRTKVYALFDDWAQLRKEAGLPGRVDRSSYSPEGLIATLREAADEWGEDLSLPEFVRHTGISPRPIERLFGNWTALKAAAGLTRSRKPGPRPRWTKDELLAALRRVTTERGDVSLRAFCRELDVSPSTIERLGAWGDLRREAGLPRQARSGRPLWETQLVGDLFDPQTELVGDLPLGATPASRRKVGLGTLGHTRSGDGPATATCCRPANHESPRTNHKERQSAALLPTLLGDVDMAPEADDSGSPKSLVHHGLAPTETSVPPVNSALTSPSVGNTSTSDDAVVGGSGGGASRSAADRVMSQRINRSPHRSHPPLCPSARRRSAYFVRGSFAPLLLCPFAPLLLCSFAAQPPAALRLQQKNASQAGGRSCGAFWGGAIRLPISRG